MDRDRRFLILRYKTQFFQDERGVRESFPPEVMERLSPETQALAAHGSGVGNKGPRQTGYRDVDVIRLNRNGNR